jgi:hypothetical protein
LASAKYSNVCWVKPSPGAVAIVIPAWPPVFSASAAASMLSKDVGASSPAASNRSVR